MTNLQIISAMLNLQQRLNDDTNGAGWEEGYTREGKLIRWRRCIYMECAELIDSFAWKHWKNIAAPTNWDNVRIENRKHEISAQKLTQIKAKATALVYDDFYIVYIFDSS